MTLDEAMSIMQHAQRTAATAGGTLLGKWWGWTPEGGWFLGEATIKGIGKGGTR